MQSFQKYIQNISRDLAGGKATEHTYRGDLRDFILSILGSGFKLTNEPSRQKCGAPDYILEKGDIPIGYIEAKDIGRLDALTKTEKDQFERYTTSLDNLIYTDYLEFRFYRQGQLVASLKVGEVKNGKVEAISGHLEQFKNLIQGFGSYRTQTIKSSKTLASMMAKKARMMKDVFYNILQEGGEGDLQDQYKTFKDLLIHDITPQDFADVYAETLAYGLFTARLHDTSLDTFTREEAYSLIPSSNPFLKKLFQYISTDLDDRAIWVVNDLCDIFRATDVSAMLKSFNKGTGRTDPFLHFYESFLGEYNPQKKKSRGVWYTPESVVSFIVRGVDEILQTHFNLPKGLADTSKTKIMVDTQTTDRRTKTGVKQVEQEVHRVQVLDVATGTGTFLAEVISQIHQRFANQQGVWSSYVDEHLIPRLHGFELLMASYAMCHMKLELLLRETGYRAKANAPRLSVYLTNSLQQAEEETDRLRLVKWFSNESNEASRIKRNSPIMVAIGNPPYSGESSNKEEWILDLLKAYKQEPSGGKLKERNPKWLNDDYVKFMRLGEYYIHKNGDGILAYITNHSWLDNPTFRGMRWHLLNTFDSIYVLDLHGNSKKKEVSPDGSPDKNVFDIQQGVSITLAVKTNRKDKKVLAEVYHAEVWGSRAIKYEFLDVNSLKSIRWKKLTPQEPFYFMIPKNMDDAEEYYRGFSLNQIFPMNSVGIITARDLLTIHEKPETLLNTAQKFIASDAETARHIFNLGKDARDWKVAFAQEDLRKLGSFEDVVTKITYRPFDNRYTLYTGTTKGFHCMPRSEVMRNFVNKENIGLISVRQVAEGIFNHAYVTKHITESRATLSNKGVCYLFPLYRYDNGGMFDKKVANLDVIFWKNIQKISSAAADPQAVFDYVYAVLHAPSYRTKYAEFLKSDFPRIPYPKTAKQFERLVALGAHLRQLHLLEHPNCDQGSVGYPVDGSHQVEKPRYMDGKVYINATQYFSNVPKEAWEFPIGGYQPAQKWLKDRIGKSLSLDDINHYQTIIAVLIKSGEIMHKIDEVLKG